MTIPLPDPMKAKRKIDEALEYFKYLGFPRQQHNERSALTLLFITGVESRNRVVRSGVHPLKEALRR